MKKVSRRSEKQCKECFEYQPVHYAKCKNCGSDFSHKPSDLSIWQRIKRVFGV